MTSPVAAMGGPMPVAPIRGAILGKQDFLSMLVAQLRNQDPLNPMDGADYAAQLAQFSSVEQLIEIGAKLDGQAADMARSILMGQTQLGASLVGREVTLRGGALWSDGTAPGRVILELPARAERVEIEVFDAAGRRVASERFDALPAGRAALTLGGDPLPAGEYTYTAKALDGQGNAITADLFTVGQVDGVSFIGGQVALRVNGRLVPLLDIIEILTAAPAAGPASLTEEFTEP